MCQEFELVTLDLWFLTLCFPPRRRRRWGPTVDPGAVGKREWKISQATFVKLAAGSQDRSWEPKPSQSIKYSKWPWRQRDCRTCFTLKKVPSVPTIGGGGGWTLLAKVFGWNGSNSDVWKTSWIFSEAGSFRRKATGLNCSMIVNGPRRLWSSFWHGRVVFRRD